jgi:hypothetical protein
LTDIELRRFASFYGASWPMHRMKADTVDAARIWLGEFTLVQATRALKSLGSQDGGMQFPPTLSQLHARILELAVPPPSYHVLVAPSEDWPPALPLEPIPPIPDDLRHLYTKQKHDDSSVPDRGAGEAAPLARQT